MVDGLNTEETGDKMGNKARIGQNRAEIF